MSHLKIRSKPNGQLIVLDATGKPIEGVVAVSIDAVAYNNMMPRVCIGAYADVVVDVTADIERMPAPENQQSQTGEQTPAPTSVGDTSTAA